MGKSKGSDTTDRRSLVLRQVLVVVRPLVNWLLRSGVGYAEFAAALKPLFLRAARDEQQRIGARSTDSSLSLLSGLHRKDVRALNAQMDTAEASPAIKASPAFGVLMRWLALTRRVSLPWEQSADDALSFESLVQSVTRDMHARAVADELVRLGYVELRGNRVHLRRDAFTPDAQSLEAADLLASNSRDHLAAAVHNLTAIDEQRFLEQSVAAAALPVTVVDALHSQAREQWTRVLHETMALGQKLEQEAPPSPATQRLRLGMYFYAEDNEAAAPSSDPTRSDGAPS